MYVCTCERERERESGCLWAFALPLCSSRIELITSIDASISYTKHTLKKKEGIQKESNHLGCIPSLGIPEAHSHHSHKYVCSLLNAQIYTTIACIYVYKYARIKSESDPLSPTTTSTIFITETEKNEIISFEILAKTDLNNRQHTHSTALNRTMRFGIRCLLVMSSI